MDSVFTYTQYVYNKTITEAVDILNLPQKDTCELIKHFMVEYFDIIHNIRPLASYHGYEEKLDIYGFEFVFTTEDATFLSDSMQLDEHPQLLNEELLAYATSQLNHYQFH